MLDHACSADDAGSLLAALHHSELDQRSLGILENGSEGQLDLLGDFAHAEEGVLDGLRMLERTLADAALEGAADAPATEHAAPIAEGESGGSTSGAAAIDGPAAVEAPASAPSGAEVIAVSAASFLRV